MKLLLINIFLISLFLSGQQLTKVREWKHDKRLEGTILYSVVDQNGNLIVFFNKDGLYQLNEQKCELFSRMGEGPSEWSNVVRGLCRYQNGVAMREMHGRTKIFLPNQTNQYRYEKTVWLNSKSPAMLGKDLFYHENCFFLIGMEMLKIEESDFRVNRIKIFDESTKKVLASLIPEHFNGPTRQYETTLHLSPFENKILAVKETELVLYEIQKGDFDCKKIELTVPSGYRAMPESFYDFKIKYTNDNQFVKNLETWSTGYSAVTQSVVVGDKLIVQIRSFDTPNGKFSILLYDINNHYRLEKVSHTNDLLLGQFNNQLFCFKNGAPLLDDEAETLTINIYSL